MSSTHHATTKEDNKFRLLFYGTKRLLALTCVMWAVGTPLIGGASGSVFSSPFGNVSPREQKEQKDEEARRLTQLKNIRPLAFLSHHQRVALANRLDSLSDPERVALLTEYFPAFSKLPQQVQDEGLAQLALVVPPPSQSSTARFNIDMSAIDIMHALLPVPGR